MDGETDKDGGRGGPVLTAAEVAGLLQLNVDYVRWLSRQGVLPAHRVPGGRVYRYLRDEVLGWLAEQPGGARAGRAAEPPRPCQPPD